MKYVLALVAGYYVLEGLRHLVHQARRWNSEDSSLSLGFRCLLVVTILATCIFWPVMMIFGRRTETTQVSED